MLIKVIKAVLRVKLGPEGAWLGDNKSEKNFESPD